MIPNQVAPFYVPRRCFLSLALNATDSVTVVISFLHIQPLYDSSVPSFENNMQLYHI